MVAVIKAGHSLHRIFNYNENKVREGIAEIIGGENYPFDPEEMAVTMRLNRLLKQMDLRRDIKVNSVHISLNFHPSESHLDNKKLMEIAGVYMEKLGFGKQPFLVYRHHDAGHPHLHLVTTNITPESGRIDLHHLARRKSEPARKEVEEIFHLTPAEGQQAKERYKVEPVTLARINYGKTESKKAMTTVLNHVLANYKFTSLPELNAVLRQYNIIADRGSEDSRVFKANGLVYRILDGHGNPVGVPIKASDFYNRPTLKFLESRYGINQVKRTPYKGRVKNAIDMALLGGKMSLQELVDKLRQQGIHAALRQNESGLIYGITYVDHTTKCVFNGSTLGKQYSAKAIQERCLSEQQSPAAFAAQKAMGLQSSPHASPTETASAETSSVSINPLDVLLQTEHVSDYIPYPLKGSKKKRKERSRICSLLSVLMLCKKGERMCSPFLFIGAKVAKLFTFYQLL